VAVCFLAFSLHVKTIVAVFLQLLLKCSSHLHDRSNGAISDLFFPRFSSGFSIGYIYPVFTSVIRILLTVSYITQG
jgi:hypothetical protein